MIKIPKLPWLIAGMLFLSTLINYTARLTLSVVVGNVLHDFSMTETDYSQWTGVIYDLGNSPRSTAWPLRTLAWAATFALDGSVEQGYFTDHLNLTLQMTQGRLNLNPNGRTCTGFNASTETDPWKMGRCFYENGSTSNVLHMFMGISADLYATPCYCTVSPQAAGIYSQWQHQYVMVSLSHLLDLGWDVKQILQFIA